MNEIILLLLMLTYVNCFNVDVRNVVTFSGQENSLFGYNGILQRNWIVTAAPRGNLTVNPRLTSPGVVYKCPVDFTTTPQQTCEEIPIQAIKVDTPREESEFEQANQFLGGSMVECKDNIVVCAHLWKQFSPQQYSTGRCHLINNNLRDVNTNRPFTFTSDEIFDTDGYHAAFGMIGFSATKSNNPSVSVISGPGLDEKGGFLTYQEDILDYTIYKALDGDDTKSFLQQSYIGYSIAVGRFTSGIDCENDPVLLGMPRFATKSQGHTGSVILVCDGKLSRRKDITILKQFFGNQIGSGFGYDIIVCDYNGDKKDDVVVSAPFQSRDRSIDAGAAFIFIGTGDNNYLNPINETLVGDEVSFGRFGYSMASLGDINADGIDDIAISAPFEGSGVVYIFNGKFGMINTKYSQKIYGKDIHSGIISFGSFISQSHDMDGNGFLDFAIGSPLSDRITLLRTRPVLLVTPTLDILPSTIPLNSTGLECSTDGSTTPCTTVKMCFSFTGPGLDMIDTTHITYNLTADHERMSKRLSSRFHIVFDNINVNNKFVMENKIIRKDIQTCDTAVVRVTTADRRFFASLEEDLTMQIEYSLRGNPGYRDISPVLNPDSLSRLTARAPFQTGCVGRCNPDLQVSVEANPSTITFGQTNELVLKLTLINADEPAFAPSIQIMFKNDTRYVTFRPLPQESTVSVNCGQGESNDTIICSCGNQLLQNQLATFEVIFDVSRSVLLQHNINSTDFPRIVNVNAIASAKPDIDSNTADNTAEVFVPVVYESSVVLSGTSSPEQGIISDSISKLSFTHTYEVYNTGPSPVMSSYLYIELLSYNSKQEQFVDPSTLKINTDNNETNCMVIARAGGNVNPGVNIDPDVTKTTTDVKEKKIITNLKCENRNSEQCIIVQCSLKQIEVSASTTVNVKFDLDAKYISFDQESSVYYITNGYIFPVAGDIEFRLISNETTTVISELYPEEPTIATASAVNLWIIIGGVIAGVVLLVVVGASLWKCGFFKRAKREQVDDYKRKSNYYERRKTARLEAARSKVMSKTMSRSDEVILHHK